MTRAVRLGRPTTTDRRVTKHMRGVYVAFRHNRTAADAMWENLHVEAP